MRLGSQIRLLHQQNRLGLLVLSDLYYHQSRHRQQVPKDQLDLLVQWVQLVLYYQQVC